MFRNSKISRALAGKIAKAAKGAVDSYQARLIEQEPQITDRFLGACQHSINNTRIGGVHWVAKTFTDRGSNSQEKHFGADFLCSFSLKLPTFTVSKSFLAQAKRVEPSDYFSPTTCADMSSQCENMLGISPASFVFLYSRQAGVQVVPAISVVSARPCNPHELTSYSVSEFFTDHFECFIGDRSMAISSSAGVEGLLADLHVRKALALVGHGDEV